MTAENQVKEIITMLSPEDSTGVDAVFVVQKYMQKTAEKLLAQEKQIALLEAQLEARAKEKHDVINEKLDSERRLGKEKDELSAKLDRREQRSEKPGSGGGRTL